MENVGLLPLEGVTPGSRTGSVRYLSGVTAIVGQAPLDASYHVQNGTSAIPYHQAARTPCSSIPPVGIFADFFSPFGGPLLQNAQFATLCHPLLPPAAAGADAGGEPMPRSLSGTALAAGECRLRFPAQNPRLAPCGSRRREVGRGFFGGKGTVQRLSTVH